MRGCVFGKRKVVLLTLYENIFISHFGDRNNWAVSSALVRHAALHLASSDACCAMCIARDLSAAGNCWCSAQDACPEFRQMDHGQMLHRSQRGKDARIDNTSAIQ